MRKSKIEIDIPSQELKFNELIEISGELYECISRDTKEIIFIEIDKLYTPYLKITKDGNIVLTEPNYKFIEKTAIPLKKVFLIEDTILETFESNNYTVKKYKLDNIVIDILTTISTIEKASQNINNLIQDIEEIEECINKFNEKRYLVKFKDKFNNSVFVVKPIEMKFVKSHTHSDDTAQLNGNKIFCVRKVSNLYIDKNDRNILMCDIEYEFKDFNRKNQKIEIKNVPVLRNMFKVNYLNQEIYLF
jgi:hypothetical protein